MLLRPGERGIAGELCDCNLGAGKVQGKLYLTDQRILYELHESPGIFQPGRVITHIDLGLQEIRNISVVSQLIGGPRLQLEIRGNHCTFTVQDPRGWATAIAHARAAVPPPAPFLHVPPPPPPPPPGGGFTPVVVNVAPASATSHTVERQVVKVRCRHCGRLSDELPGKCSGCGAPL
ncbi:MAG: hypothetical protein L3K17_05975 [Thermoplasmata archaeon]|nr:hypothetical protein [Thermoplasmata archaeon]